MSQDPEEGENLPSDESALPEAEPAEEMPSVPPAQDIPVRNYYEQPSGRGYVPPPAGPLPLSQALRGLPEQYIKILTRPGAQAFAEEQGKAEWGIIWLQLLILTLISTVMSVFRAVIHFTPGFYGLPMMPADKGMAFNESLISLLASGSGIISTALSVAAGFFIINGVQYLLAKAFKGSGDFKTQSYNYLLFIVPLSVISGLLGLVPLAGLNIAIGLGTAVYQIVLNVFSIQATHRLSGGRATATVLIPIGAAVLLFLICATTAAVAIFAMISTH